MPYVTFLNIKTFYGGKLNNEQDDKGYFEKC